MTAFEAKYCFGSWREVALPRSMGEGGDGDGCPDNDLCPELILCGL